MRKRVKKTRFAFFKFLLILPFWASIGFVVYFIDPFSPGAVALFMFLAFVACFLTATFLLKNTRRGLLLALSICAFLLLGYLGVGNILNLLLIAAIAISLEVYFSKN